MSRAAAILSTSPARRRWPMPRDQERDYEVGYGKPPRPTRFKRGQSGNPRGRSSGAKNLKTLLSDALNERVTVSKNGGGHAKSPSARRSSPSSSTARPQRIGARSRSSST